MTQPWLDVSVTLHSGMVHWPGDPAVQIERISDIERGDVCTVSKLDMGSHTGTHMDAPAHFVRGARSLDEMPLDATIGPARVIEIHNPAAITSEELRHQAIQRGERILFKTQNSTRCWNTDGFIEDFVSISPEAAQYLASLQVLMVGVDYLSVGAFKQGGPETHRALLEAGIWIIEGLNLSQVSPGLYDLICLPLKVAHSDGAPARAIVRKTG